MSIKVVYWSGTGNTAEMANLVAKGIQDAGKEAELLTVESTTPEALAGETVYALGCPSMGDEVLEEDVMEPFVAALLGSVSGKKIALFGSYGWGDGQWMRDWVKRMEDAGATVVGGGVIANGFPEGGDRDLCENLGKELAGC